MQQPGQLDVRREALLPHLARQHRRRRTSRRRRRRGRGGAVGLGEAAAARRRAIARHQAAEVASARRLLERIEIAVQRGQHLGGALPAQREIAVQRLHHHLVEPRRHRRVMEARRQDLRVGHRRQRGRGVGAGEQALAGEHLPQEDAGGEQIALAGERLPLHLLGRHIRKGAGRGVAGEVAALAEGHGDAEVHQLDLAVARDHHVAARQIAVDDAVALAVGVVEPVEDLGGDVRGQRRRHRAALQAQLLGEPKQARPVDVLHRDVIGLADHAQLVDRHDVAVHQPDEDLGLGDEQIDEVALAREPRMDLLDDQVLLEAAGADELAEIDLGHAASGELLGQVVLAEGRGDLGHAGASVSSEK